MTLRSGQVLNLPLHLTRSDFPRFNLRDRFDPGAIQILPIHLPLQRIVRDVFADAIQFIFSANHMFLIIALPDRHAERVAQFIYAAR